MTPIYSSLSPRDHLVSIGSSHSFSRPEQCRGLAHSVRCRLIQEQGELQNDTGAGRPKGLKMVIGPVKRKEWRMKLGIKRWAAGKLWLITCGSSPYPFPAGPYARCAPSHIARSISSLRGAIFIYIFCVDCIALKRFCISKSAVEISQNKDLLWLTP